jgi:gamma-glutamylcyclotransferase (GGCT)/AIG2-like uncharacterized protein YtfP
LQIDHILGYIKKRYPDDFPRKLMNAAVFTYGSLMFPEVWQRVVRGSYGFAPVVAQGYRRFAVQGYLYPGMIAQAGAHVAGLVYFDVDAADLARLDAFEGDEYRREIVHVIADPGMSIPVSAYLYSPAEKLSKLAWHPEEFDLQGFLNTYCGFRPV